MQKSVWYVLCTRPFHEKKVALSLKKNGVECFLPLVSEMRQRVDRKVKVQTPLFPSYLFVKVPSRDLSQIYVPGVVRLLSFSGKPAVISERTVLNVQLSLQGHPRLTSDSISLGEHVEIASGPMQGLRGVLVKHRGRNRLAVKVEIMRRYVLLDISPRVAITRKVPKSRVE